MAVAEVGTSTVDMDRRNMCALRALLAWVLDALIRGCDKIHVMDYIISNNSIICMLISNRAN